MPNIENLQLSNSSQAGGRFSTGGFGGISFGSKNEVDINTLIIVAVVVVIGVIVAGRK